MKTVTGPRLSALFGSSRSVGLLYDKEGVMGEGLNDVPLLNDFVALENKLFER